MNNDLLKEMALKCREDVIYMSSRGGCFIGASLSCIEIIIYI